MSWFFCARCSRCAPRSTRRCPVASRRSTACATCRSCSDAGMNPYPIEGEDVTKTHGWDGSVMVLSVPGRPSIYSPHQNIPEKNILFRVAFAPA